MIEKHPFGDFVPKKARYLILGSFTTKEAYDKKKKYEWFYSNGRNQFWPILENVYKKELKTRVQMQKLFTDLHMALADIISLCERKKNSNLDINLTHIVYNSKGLEKILRRCSIEKIFFSSRFVENKFRQHFKYLIAEFPNVNLVTLPSPSPRYAAMTKTEKIKKYQTLLPKLN